MTATLKAGPPEAWQPPQHRVAPPPTRLRPDDVLLAIGLGALAMVVWPYLNALRGPAPLQLPVVIAHVAGMLAGYGVVVLVGLMSRTPSLERGIGADRLSRWHSQGGRIVVGLVLVHAWAATVAWPTAGRRASGSRYGMCCDCRG